MTIIANGFPTSYQSSICLIHFLLPKKKKKQKETLPDMFTHPTNSGKLEPKWAKPCLGKILFWHWNSLLWDDNPKISNGFCIQSKWGQSEKYFKCGVKVQLEDVVGDWEGLEEENVHIRCRFSTLCWCWLIHLWKKISDPLANWSHLMTMVARKSLSQNPVLCNFLCDFTIVV